MSDRTIDYEFPAPWPYEGEVIARSEDGWVKVRIEGEMPESPWYPVVGGPACGKSDHGAAIIPPVGAVVKVEFIGGNRESGRVTPGYYGDGQLPDGTEITDDGDQVVWRDGRVEVLVDGRNGTTGVRIRDQATSGNGVLLDVDIGNRQVNITSALGIAINTTGLLSLQGSTITVGGRAVRRGSDPI